MDNSTSNKVYEGVAEYGKIRSLVGAITMTIIGMIIIVIGMFLILKKEIYNAEILGSVTKSKCDAVNVIFDKNKPIKKYNCEITVSYVVAGNIYEKSFVLQEDNSIIVGSSQMIEYETTNPTNSRIKEFSKKYIGGIIIAVSVVFLLLSWLSYYFAKNNKTYAAATGSVGLMGDVGSVVKSFK